LRTIAISAIGLILLVTLGESTAHAGACAPPRYFAVVDVDGGRALQRNRRVTVRYGLNFRTRGGWPDCSSQVKKVKAVVELSRSRSRKGPWTRIARGSSRTAHWTPTALGLGWLRAQAKDPYGRVQTRITGVFVGNGTVVLPTTRYRYTRAQLWADGRATDVVAGLPAGSPPAATLELPRAAGWWLLSGQGPLAWARVTAAGKVRVTLAPNSLLVKLDNVIRRGWEVWIHHSGMPRIPQSSQGPCVLHHLPSGPVSLQVRPVANGEKPRSVPLLLKPRMKNRIAVSAMHLLARKTQPAKGQWDLLKSPTLRGKSGKNACKNARPFDGRKGPAALGRALCGRVKGRTAWVPRISPPAYLVRGGATHPAVHGTYTVWAESEVRPKGFDGRVLLYVATSTGVIAERVPLLDQGRAAAVAVTPTGEVWVVGRTGYSSARAGFVAVRRKLGWQVFKRSSPVLAVTPHGRGVLVMNSYGVTRCTNRCRAGAQSKESLAAFATTRQGLSAVAKSGALYSIRGRQLRRTRAKPSIGFTLTRVVSAKHGIFGLFGPEITGSEYHPYCVASVIARLTRIGWKTVHRVGGSTGRRLSCQDDDRPPPVVMDFGVAGRAIYARRRARRAGLLPGYKFIYLIPKP